MSDNVLILGAGFSYDAGIPLLRGFVETMLDCALRKSCNGHPLDATDIEIFENAIKIRNDLDRYHGRAEFDDRNIEDILSILSFDALDGSRKGRNKLIAINRAIARTIELSCSVKAPDISNYGDDNSRLSGPDIYRNFWKALFSWVLQGKSLPTIITFNYDLVLERSLLQMVSNDFYAGPETQLPFDNFVVKYYYPAFPGILYHVKTVPYGPINSPKLINTVQPIEEGSNNQKTLGIEILKLHGSLNFQNSKQVIAERKYNFVDTVNDPYILPPVFNKMSSDSPGSMWKRALDHLRKAKKTTSR
jgi:hypothetical protein